MSLLDVKDLKTYFYTDSGVAKAVDGVTFSVDKGKVLGIVGESGCGKSVTSLSIMRLVDPVTGKDPAIEPFSKAESKGIPVWLTEISDPTESYDATMTSGLKWAKKFHRFLCEANTGAIVWWAGAIPDGGTTEGLINIEKNRVDYEVTKRCEVFGNFSRYIPVGSKRISAQYDFEQGYMVSGYKYGDNGYTVVAINPADHEVVISLALESAQVSGALQGYVTDDTRKWEPVEAVQPADGVYILTLPARSVVSYTGTVLSSSSL